ncbi:MAG: hypothetical protein HND52_00415 [Ignavibacteriae bacterium]|jgi:uncharacterized membrane protein (Fun14 family)|nr:hypothetical protein [Ignavibacteriota bacterium]NOG96410.1 hypothetical protein [Ignavibacteriota bacterium]
MPDSLFTFSIKTALMGAAIGFILGYLAKKVSKILIIALIIIVIVVQLGIYDGMIQIDWLTYKPMVEGAIEDGKSAVLGYKDYLVDNLAFFVSLGVGFILGFSKG